MAHVTSPASDLPETPELSVVISVYNGEDRLEASLRSVLEQQGPSFEVILINDGSGPKATVILREIAARDRRVRLIEQENTGLTVALIRGCKEARADVIVRHDADDISLPGRFAALTAAFQEHPNAVLVTTSAETRGPRDEPMYTVSRPTDPEEWRQGLIHHKQGPPAHGATAFRRTAYNAAGGYRSAFYYAQDSDLWLRLASLGMVICLPQVLYAFRFSPESISGSEGSCQRAFGSLGQECHQLRLAGKDDTQLLKRAALIRAQMRDKPKASSSAANYFVGSCLARRNDRRCLRYLAKAWTARPWNPVYLLKLMLAATRTGWKPSDGRHPPPSAT